MILKKLSAAGLLISCVLSAVGFLGLAQTASAAALTSTNVEPTSLEASVFTNATVSFTTTTTIPANGKIKVTFPAGFNVAGIGPVSCSTIDGGVTFNASGQIVTITRSNNGTPQTAAAETCTINNIITPSSAGVTGTYTIETTDGANASLDIDAAVAGDTITASTAGALTSTNVQPASLVASTTNTVTITFTTANSIPANGKIKVTFPNGFNTAGVNSPACSTMDGTFTVASGGNNITITRNNDGTVQTAGAESCTIGNITNPGASGTTSTYAIQTLTSTTTVIDQDLAVAGDTLTAPAAGPLTSTDVQPASLVQNTTSTVTVTFTTTTTIPADGKIKVTFPAGFNVASVNSATCSTMDGGFTFGVGGQTVTINRNNTGTGQTSAAESCTIGNVTNPAATGVTGTYTIQTANQSNTVLDQDTNVPGDTITGVSAGALTSTNVQPASLVQSTTNTVTVTFTTTTTIPADGKIQVIFPAGFNVSSVNSASCSTMDGGFNFNPNGQTVIITRNNTGTGQTSAAESCTIGNITNPAATGTTGTYTIQTTNASNAVLDQDTNVPGDTISASSAGALTSTNVQPASLVAGASGSVTVSFTTTTSIPANGKVSITFPTGFQLGGAGPVSCSTMDGNVSFGVGGQTITINRDGTGTIQTSAAEQCTIGGNVTNPPVSGTTGTYSIQTTDGSNVVLDQDLAVAADTITAAALTSTNVQPTSLTAGATSVVTVSFTNVNTIKNNGKIKVTFGSGFNVSGASGGTCSTMDGSFITSISGQTVTLTRAGGSNKTAGVETCTINNVVNPQVSGTTGTYTISTTANNDSISDTDASVTADTITAAALTSTNVEPANLISVSTSTVTISFTTANPVPSDGKVKVTFPSGFSITSASGGTCSTMDGSFATSIDSQTVIITRSGGTSEPAGAQTCTVGGIRNPSASGATGTYTLTTTNSASATIDSASAASDTIIGQSSSGSSTPVALTYAIEIATPVADDAYTFGDTITITWSTGNSTGNIGAINLDYSTDGGASYTTIVTGASDSGSYAWTAPNITSSTVTVRAKATDLVTTLATDTSSEFSITGTTTSGSPTETPSTSTEDPGGSSNGVTIYPAGSMLHVSSSPTVYYIDTTGARRPFLDPQTYFTYATSFDALIEVSATELSAYTLGLPMLPKAGTVLVKVSSSNKVYALESLDGVTYLRWITSEGVAEDLFGDAWSSYIIDIDPVLWGHVTIGDGVSSTSDLEVDLTRMFARDVLNTLK